MNQQILNANPADPQGLSAEGRFLLPKHATRRRSKCSRKP